VCRLCHDLDRSEQLRCLRERLPGACHTVATCVDGTCGFVCEAGFADCNNDPADGCETDVTSDVDNCGACGRVCTGANATMACASGTCVIVACDAGFADCDGIVTNGCETHLSSDVNNCGACGQVCTGANATMACASGACVIAGCFPGFADCDGNAANGCETNLRSDIGNCGACGHVCTGANATMACASGTCVIVACDAGFADCDGNAANGCETNLRSDIGNCGACGHSCGQGQTCVAGVCTS
jgi:hypothetical protein